MKKKLVFLGVMLGLGLADSAMAHTTYLPSGTLTVGTPVTVGGFTNYGWIHGTRVNGRPLYYTGTATNAITDLGNSHDLQIGGAVSGSTYVQLFKFVASNTSHTIKVTETTVSATDIMDPAISLYQGTLAEQAHDLAAPDPLIPNAALPGETTTAAHWPFDGYRQTGVVYDGQFDAFGNFSIASAVAGSRATLTWKASASAAKYVPTAADITAGAPAAGRGGNGNHTKTETLSATGLTVGTVYTVIVGGERCVNKGKSPYNWVLPANYYCPGGSTPNGAGRYTATVTLN